MLNQEPGNNSNVNIPRTKVFQLIFIFLVIIMFIQTYTNILWDKNLRLLKVIDEKEKLTRLAASSIENPYYQVTPAHKKEVINSLGQLSDTEFCRIVNDSGVIYMSTIPSEAGKVINHGAVKTKKVLTLDDTWNNKNIKVVIAPAENRYTLWLGYNVEKIFDQLNKMVFGHIKIAFIMLLVLLVYITYASERIEKNNYVLDIVQEEPEGNAAKYPSSS